MLIILLPLAFPLFHHLAVYFPFLVPLSHQVSFFILFDVWRTFHWVQRYNCLETHEQVIVHLDNGLPYAAAGTIHEDAVRESSYSTNTTLLPFLDSLTFLYFLLTF